MQHSFNYNIGKYSLRINYWFLIIFLLIQTGLNELGFWQLSRAQEKQARLDILASTHEPIIKNLDLVEQTTINRFARTKLKLSLIKNQNIIIENKIQNGELGYHVLNVVEDVASGKILLANRGWIGARANRSEIPSVQLPPLEWSAESRIYTINPQVLSQDAVLEDHGQVLRLPVLDTHMLMLLEKKLNLKLEPYLLRLEKNSPGALNIDWAWVSMTPEKHLGYAFQWFGLSLTFLIASLFALIKKK